MYPLLFHRMWTLPGIRCIRLLRIHPHLPDGGTNSTFLTICLCILRQQLMLILQVEISISVYERLSHQKWSNRVRVLFVRADYEYPIKLPAIRINTAIIGTILILIFLVKWWWHSFEFPHPQIRMQMMCHNIVYLIRVLT